jgi:hypothetical protein
MPKKSTIAVRLRLLADALENVSTLTEFKAIVLGLQDCISLIFLAAFAQQKRRIQESAHDIDPTESRDQGGLIG